MQKKTEGAISNKGSGDRIINLFWEFFKIGLFTIGGGAAMYLTMLLIRHKTKHVKFMLGIPLMISLHAVIIYLLFHYNII